MKNSISMPILLTSVLSYMINKINTLVISHQTKFRFLKAYTHGTLWINVSILVPMYLPLP